MERFGPFALDRRTWTVLRDGAAVDLSPRLVEILAYLIDRDGAIATRDELLDRFWPDVHVTENTLTRAVADIRKALGDASDRPDVIQTVARRGYRFVGTVERGAGAMPAPGAASTAPQADPFRLWVSGRLALESLDPARLDAAAAAMDAAVASMPDYAPAHAGAANARVIAFELTRTANQPDVALLRAALSSAQRAVAIDGRLGEGWAVLGHAQSLAGLTEDAQASLRHALALEPDNWRHHVRLAMASWGEPRLRAADRALALWPSCAAAHLLSGMVYVARGAWSRAESVAATGATLQDAQASQAVLPVAGLHWLRGLALVGQRRYAEALDAFVEEDAHAGHGVYAAESRWLATSSRGCLLVHAGRLDEARIAFETAAVHNRGAARSVLGLHLVSRADRASLDAALGELRGGPKRLDAVLVEAAAEAWSGRIPEAIARLRASLDAAPPGAAAWNLHADPMFLPLHAEARAHGLFAAVAARAA
jgi:DNA-binding winged helix-turn-helix (wHTH) protein